MSLCVCSSASVCLSHSAHVEVRTGTDLWVPVFSFYHMSPRTELGHYLHVSALTCSAILLAQQWVLSISTSTLKNLTWPAFFTHLACVSGIARYSLKECQSPIFIAKWNFLFPKWRVIHGRVWSLGVQHLFQHSGCQDKRIAEGLRPFWTQWVTDQEGLDSVSKQTAPWLNNISKENSPSHHYPILWMELCARRTQPWRI